MGDAVVAASKGIIRPGGVTSAGGGPGGGVVGDAGGGPPVGESLGSEDGEPEGLVEPDPLGLGDELGLSDGEAPGGVLQLGVGWGVVYPFGPGWLGRDEELADRDGLAGPDAGAVMPGVLIFVAVRGAVPACGSAAMAQVAAPTTKRNVAPAAAGRSQRDHPA